MSSFNPLQPRHPSRTLPELLPTASSPSLPPYSPNSINGVETWPNLLLPQQVLPDPSEDFPATHDLSHNDHSCLPATLLAHGSIVHGHLYCFSKHPVPSRLPSLGLAPAAAGNRRTPSSRSSSPACYCRCPCNPRVLPGSRFEEGDRATMLYHLNPPNGLNQLDVRSESKSAQWFWLTQVPPDFESYNNPAEPTLDRFEPTLFIGCCYSARPMSYNTLGWYCSSRMSYSTLGWYCSSWFSYSTSVL